MRKLSLYLLILFVMPAFVLTSCKDDDETVDPASEILKDYLLENDMDLGSIIKYHGTDGDIKFVTAAPDSTGLADFLAKYYIMDIRSADDFNAGHIEGANNVAFSDLLTDAANAGSQKILVVCYSGQTACFGTSLLRLAGYSDAQALKWGMSGWHTDFSAKWDGKIGSNTAEGHANWTYDAAPANVTYSAPEITGSTDGETLLMERVEAVMAEGFGAHAVSGDDVLESPSGYFVNNYFSEADYTAFGHINGAYRINPLLLEDESIYNLDPDAAVVTYCYTGQTSAVISAYLAVLGYDSKSMLYGMNGVYNTNPAWTSNQWGTDSNPKGLPYVTE